MPSAHNTHNTDAIRPKNLIASMLKFSLLSPSLSLRSPRILPVSRSSMHEGIGVSQIIFAI